MSKDNGWRYQAVYIERDADENEKILEFSICEVYLDKDGKLKMWTESHRMSPYGETIDELIGDLQFMIDDVRKWQPVPFNSMQVGMDFERT
jgi:hypothetical protein